MYMSGSTIQIFSAMAVIMLVKTSIGGALNVNNGRSLGKPTESNCTDSGTDLRPPPLLLHLL